MLTYADLCRLEELGFVVTRIAALHQPDLEASFVNSVAGIAC
jgi:hypothetical protein